MFGLWDAYFINYAQEDILLKLTIKLLSLLKSSLESTLLYHLIILKMLLGSSGYAFQLIIKEDRLFNICLRTIVIHI